MKNIGKWLTDVTVSARDSAKDYRYNELEAANVRKISAKNRKSDSHSHKAYDESPSLGWMKSKQRQRRHIMSGSSSRRHGSWRRESDSLRRSVSTPTIAESHYDSVTSDLSEDSNSPGLNNLGRKNVTQNEMLFERVKELTLDIKSKEILMEQYEEKTRALDHSVDQLAKMNESLSAEVNQLREQNDSLCDPIITQEQTSVKSHFGPTGIEKEFQNSECQTVGSAEDYKGKHLLNRDTKTDPSVVELEPSVKTVKRRSSCPSLNSDAKEIDSASSTESAEENVLSWNKFKVIHGERRRVNEAEYWKAETEKLKKQIDSMEFDRLENVRLKSVMMESDRLQKKSENNFETLNARLQLETNDLKEQISSLVEKNTDLKKFNSALAEERNLILTSSDEKGDKYKKEVIDLQRQLEETNEKWNDEKMTLESQFNNMYLSNKRLVDNEIELNDKINNLQRQLDESVSLLKRLNDEKHARGDEIKHHEKQKQNWSIDREVWKTRETDLQEAVQVLSEELQTNKKKVVDFEKECEKAKNYNQRLRAVVTQAEEKLRVYKETIQTLNEQLQQREKQLSTLSSQLSVIPDTSALKENCLDVLATISVPFKRDDTKQSRIRSGEEWSCVVLCKDVSAHINESPALAPDSMPVKKDSPATGNSELFGEQESSVKVTERASSSHNGERRFSVASKLTKFRTVFSCDIVCWIQTSELPASIPRPLDIHKHYSSETFRLETQTKLLEQAKKSVEEKLLSTTNEFEDYRQKANAALESSASQVKNQSFLEDSMKNMSEELKISRDRYRNALVQKENSEKEFNQLLNKTECMSLELSQQQRDKDTLASHIEYLKEENLKISTLAENELKKERSKVLFQRSNDLEKLEQEYENLKLKMKKLESEMLEMTRVNNDLKDTVKAQNTRDTLPSNKINKYELTTAPSLDLPKDPQRTSSISSSHSQGSSVKSPIENFKAEVRKMSDSLSHSVVESSTSSIMNMRRRAIESDQKIAELTREIQMILEMNTFLKSELRNAEAEQSRLRTFSAPKSMEYIKNTIVKFLETDEISSPEHETLMPVICNLMSISREEVDKIQEKRENLRWTSKISTFWKVL